MAVVARRSRRGGLLLGALVGATTTRGTTTAHGTATTTAHGSATTTAHGSATVDASATVDDSA
jgi:hypothetical protein